MQKFGLNGYITEVAAVIPKQVIAQQIQTADGKTTLNIHTEDHLVLHGTLTGNHDYIVCEDDNNVVKCKIDKDGKVTASDLETDTHVSIDAKISSIDNGQQTNYANIDHKQHVNCSNI